MNERNRGYNYRTQYYRPENYRTTRSTNYAINKGQKRSRKRAYLSLVTLIAIFVVGGTVVSAKHNPDSQREANLKSSLNLSDQPSNSSPSASDQLALATMGQTINSVISGNSNIDMSVSLINLSDDQKLHYGDSNTFLAGSTGKIITAEYFLHEVEAGQQSLSETVNGQTASYELQQMIVVSDDNAWVAFNNLLGYSSMQAYADSTFGFNDYQAQNNSLTSNDMAVTLEYLSEGKILNQADSTTLLSYLKQANYRNFIVPAVPSDDTVYHKIGLFDDDVNDAAIITHDNKAYVLVIFTDGNGDYNWPNRASMMQQITKASLKAYFNQT